LSASVRSRRYRGACRHAIDGVTRPNDQPYEGGNMLLILAALLLVVAIAGGVIVHPLLFLLAIVAIVVFFVDRRGRIVR
jgi:hypothetical protein